MNLNKQENDIIIIKSSEPFSTFFRRRHGQFSSAGYNDRSPAATAMKAHLRASAIEPRNSARNTPGSFLVLGREYESQARANFAKEAVLFAIITVVGLVWPILQTLRTLAH